VAWREPPQLKSATKLLSPRAVEGERVLKHQHEKLLGCASKAIRNHAICEPGKGKQEAAARCGSDAKRGLTERRIWRWEEESSW